MIAADRPVVTYSPAITLVPTYECFNRCQYCNFRVDPHQDVWLSLEQARQQLTAAKAAGAIEALILSGEVHPASDRRPQWLAHIYRLCELALAVGLLPHTNVGPLSWAEMRQLKQVNVSMGLMVEQVTPRLMAGVHRHAPSKQPQVRLEQLEQAGQLGIPFTTGLLIGIGETAADRQETLRAIAQCHHRWGHIQEVILQPHQPGTRQHRELPRCQVADLLQTVEVATALLPKDVVIQVPPNLLDHGQSLQQALRAGARDLGGLGPRDEVNPDYPHPSIAHLTTHLHQLGWRLQPRLPLYPHYDNWVAASLRPHVSAWRTQLGNAQSSQQPTAQLSVV